MTKLLTPKEAATRLRVSLSTIRAWVFLRKIEFVKVNGTLRFQDTAIDALIASGTVKPRKGRRRG